MEPINIPPANGGKLEDAPLSPKQVLDIRYTGSKESSTTSGSEEYNGKYKGPAWFEIVQRHPPKPKQKTLKLPVLGRSPRAGKVPSRLDFASADATASTINFSVLRDEDSFQEEFSQVSSSSSEFEPMLLDANELLHAKQHGLPPVLSELDEETLRQAELERERKEEEEKIRNRRIRALRLTKQAARRLESQVEERIVGKLGVGHVVKIEADDYHLPRTIALGDAKVAAEDAQSSAVRRNWNKIKLFMDEYGGVTTLEELRRILIACDITTPNAGRIVFLISQKMLPGDDLVSIDDVKKEYFSRERLARAEGKAYISDADSESSASTDCDDVQVLAMAKAVLPDFDNQGDSLFDSPEDDITKMRVARLHRKIKAALRVKGAPVGPGGDVDRTLWRLGYSIGLLKLLDRHWLGLFAYRKSSMIIRSGDQRSNSTYGELVFADTVQDVLVGKRRAKAMLRAQENLEQAVKLLHEFATVSIQSVARGFLVKSRERKLYYDSVIAKAENKRNRGWARDWFAYNKRVRNLSKARTVLLRWRGYTRVLQKRRRAFQICFWPFFIWRRYMRRKVLARRKAKFLKRVWRTYLQLVVFRTWKHEYEVTCEQLERARAKIMTLWRARQVQQFYAWRQHAKKKGILRRRWDQRGKHMRGKLDLVLLTRTFCLWKLQFAGMVLVHRRSRLYYNYVSKYFVERHERFRKRYTLPERTYIASLVPPFPSLEAIVGGNLMDVVDSDSQVRKLCFRFHLGLVGLDKHSRPSRCIERNRLGPIVLRRWRTHVEEGQKSRYAWYYFTKTVQKRVLQGWCTVAKAGRKKRLSIMQRANMGVKAPVPTVTIKPKSNSQQRTQKPKTPGTAPPPKVEKEVEPTVEESDDDSDESSIDEEKAREMELVKQRRAGAIKLREEREAIYKQLLQDNEWRAANLAQATKTAIELRKQRLVRSIQMKKHDERLQGARENASLSAMHAHDLLAEKQQELAVKREQQISNAERLHQMRGRMLHDSMCHVIDEVQQVRMDLLKERCFKMLRFPVVHRRSFSMMQRRRLRNWVRICVRLRRLWRAMPKYRLLRVKWQCFNKWLLYMDRKYKYETRGLKQELTRRVELVSAYSDFILEVGEAEAEWSRRKQYFKRWIEYIQKMVCRRRLLRLCKERRRLELVRKVVWIWRTGLKSQYATRLANKRTHKEISIEYDLVKWKYFYLKIEKQLLTAKLVKRNKYVKDRLRFAVRSHEELLLKRVVEKHKANVATRLQIEQELLCGAFQERGTYTFEDLQTSTIGMSNAEATAARFVDDPIGPNDVIASITILVKEGLLCGLQFHIGTDTGRNWSTPMHGFSKSEPGGNDDGNDVENNEEMYGPNVKLFEFKLDDKEHIIGIEVFATNNSVPGRIRFRTSHGRTSPWYGKSEIGKRYILPRSNDKVRDKNKKYAEEFIVGLHGCEGSSTLFSLGVILRQVEAVNVFSRCWMDRPDRVFQGEDEESSRRFVESTELLQQRQFNNVLAMRSADVLVARNRSLRLCLRMRYGDFIPLPLQSVRIVSAVTKWFFNALSHSLVKLTDVTDSGTSMLSAGGSDGTLTRGYQQIRSGTMLLKNSERRAKQLDELLHVGPEKTLLNEAQIGRRRFKELTEELAQKRIDIQQAEAMLAVGREVVEQGLANLPKLQTSPHSLGYYENLVHLAVVKETLKKQKSGDDS